MELIEIRVLDRVGENISFKDSKAVYTYCINMPLKMDTLAQEHLYCFCLNSKNKVITVELISKGSLTGSICHPREIFKAAIISNSASIVLAHNHPSGNIDPSVDDIGVTKRIHEVSKLIGINFLDHIIIGKGEWFSFKKDGLF